MQLSSSSSLILFIAVLAVSLVSVMSLNKYRSSNETAKNITSWFGSSEKSHSLENNSSESSSKSLSKESFEKRNKLKSHTLRSHSRQCDKDFATKNKDLAYNFTSLVSDYEYKVETHDVVTADGYILTLFRLPLQQSQIGQSSHSTKKIPVFLQHGIFDSASSWVLNHPSQSLAYLLADNRYDVWLGNVRGNRYSNRHKTFTVADTEFWDFSWQEMAEYDLPAMINYVLETTGQSKLVYIGHSQGSLIGFAKFSSDLEFSKKISHFIALAPLASVKYISCPTGSMIHSVDRLQPIVNDLGFTSVSDLRKSVAGFCTKFFNQQFCPTIYSICGEEPKKSIKDNQYLERVRLSADDTSTKNVLHFGQMVSSGLMQKYDYQNSQKNLDKYHQTSVPLYNVSKLTTPTIVFTSHIDALADSKDIGQLLKNAKSAIRSHFKIDDYNHMDFVWATDAHKKIYAKILEILSEFRQSEKNGF